LRNNGAEVFARVERGERPIVTRDGHPVAELRPLPARSEGPTELIERRKRCRASILKRCAVPWTLLSTVRCHDRRTFGGPARYLVVTTFTGRRRRASHQVTIGGQSPPNALGARNYALQGVVMAGERGHLGDELATVNPLVDGSQQNLGLTSDSSQFVCHRIECAQRV
jgi:antitoxin (DNA-binding transcriptional repressor) of toxin-antitoxin stability system